MNWLLILVLLIVAGNIAWGIYRGFLRVVFSMIAWVVILVFVTWATPFMSEVLAEHTQIDEYIEESCREKLRGLVHGNGEESPEKASDHEQLDELGLQLPEIIRGKILDTGEAADHLLEETGVYTEAAGRASDLAMRGISFALVLLITLVAFHIVSVVLDLVAKLPVIENVNSFLGGVAGFVKGVLLVWLAFAFVAMGSATSVGTGLISYIYESELLVWLYENNLVLSILMIFL